MLNPQIMLWNPRYQDPVNGPEERGIDGFGVEALDGSIGHVEHSVAEVGASRIVVDTGPWIFGTKVVLPAGVIDHVDYLDEKVFVRRTKDEIKTAPRLVDDTDLDEHMKRLDTHYGDGGAGFRPWP